MSTTVSEGTVEVGKTRKRRRFDLLDDAKCGVRYEELEVYNIIMMTSMMIHIGTSICRDWVIQNDIHTHVAC